MSKLLLIELNEINFDIVKKYISNSFMLPNLEKIMQFNNITTTAEKEYEHLEPWIQWHSVHTGKDFSEHNIFRLGDGNKSRYTSIHRKLENSGIKVGAISPINLKNDCINPSHFIPDPWIETSTDKSWWSKKIKNLLNQTVNDNASKKISFESLVMIILLIIKFAQFKNILKYFNLTITSFRKSWRRALFLDLLLHDINYYLVRKNKCEFSSVFFNAGAHIQHYFFFNSRCLDKEKNPEWYLDANDDPLLEVLKIYDDIVGDYLKIGYPLIVATGLSQVAYDRKKFYYRLSNHKEFLKLLNIKFREVQTRMSRDFSILFDKNDDRDKAFKVLSNLKEINTNIFAFGDFDVKNKEIFVTLSFPEMITNDHYIIHENKKIFLKKNTVFVCIKNGMHNEKGYAFFLGYKGRKLIQNSHIKELHNYIIDHFGLDIRLDA